MTCHRRHHEWAYAPASDAAYFSTGEWRLPSYDDSAWSRSTGRLGLKKSKADKKISGDEHVVFFRTSFDVPFDSGCARALQLRATLVQGEQECVICVDGMRVVTQQSTDRRRSRLAERRAALVAQRRRARRSDQGGARIR
jgi:hypothetical protein